MIFDDNKADLEVLKQMFKDGKAVVIGNFPEGAFEKFDEFHTEILEDELA